METSARQRIFLVDDHPLVLSGTAALIETQSHLEVVGTAFDVETAIVGIEQARPDMVIVDLSLPGRSGIALVDHLRQTSPSVLVLALTISDDAACVQQLLQAGARGFVLKRSAAEELIYAIRAVFAGGTYIDPVVAPMIVSMSTLQSGGGLSEREMAVVRLVAKGFSNKEISSQLSLSVKTIETYRSRALEKLGLKNRAALVRYAMLRGWLTE
jgi:DNA-binding NarL/FixJ family response regulator